MVRFGIVISGIGPFVDAGGFIASSKIRFAIIQPKGNIDSRDAVSSLFRGKALGQQWFSFT